jgi:nucleotide-binding universal stress UspA family protein
MNATTADRTRYLELDRLTANRSLAQRLPAELAFQYHALPIAEWEGCLTVAMAHPEDGAARSAVCQALGSTPYLVKGDAGAIDRLLAEIWPEQMPRTLRFLVLDPPAEEPAADALWNYASALGEQLGAALERVCPDPITGFSADERQADLVVMSQGERLVKGRGSGGPLAASLLVVDRPTWPPHRLLLVVRCNESGGAALDWIVSIARCGGLPVTLLIITPFLPVAYYDDCIRSLTSPHSEIGGWLCRASEQLERWQIPAAVRVRRGEPEWQLKQELAGGEYDLVVIGCGGTPRRKRWDKLTGLLLGCAHCPVLIVRQDFRSSQ